MPAAVSVRREPGIHAILVRGAALPPLHVVEDLHAIYGSESRGIRGVARAPAGLGSSAGR